MDDVKDIVLKEIKIKVKIKYKFSFDRVERKQ